MKTATHLLLGVLIVLAFACTSTQKKAPAGITSEPFGKLPDSSEVTLYTMTNKNGLEMKVISYGGIITSLKVPDREGNFEDIVLGYDNLQDYVDNNPYFGAIIGRFGNRIAKGMFTLDSIPYSLATNNGANHLHGGLKGFDKVNWKSEVIQVEDGVGVKLSYTSPDGEEGYPGTLNAEVSYILGNDNSLTFDYKATTDKKTIVNLTNHSYYNLNGMDEDILAHELVINADSFLPVDNSLIPLGIKAVEGTPFDFRSPKAIGKDILAENEQLKNGNGYDHCWVLNGSAGELTFAASLYDPSSGRLMELYTSEPGVQLYSGNFLNGSVTGKDGIVYKHRMGLCLETQHYPDSPNQLAFPSVVLNPGEDYQTITKTIFSIK